jgi:hypothetical protein
MIELQFKTTFGFSVGFEYFPPEPNLDPDVEWAVLIYLGIFQLGIGKMKM